MDATLIFATQATLSLLSFGLIAGWVIYPHLRERSLRDALTPLLLFETLRTLGLVVLAPSLAAVALPAGFGIPAAVGDFLAAMLAFVSLVAVRAGLRVAPALVWLFTVEGLADFINAAVQGIRFGIPNYPLGIVWLLLTYVVPALTVAQVLVIVLLLTRGHQRAGKQDDWKGNAQAVDVLDRPAASIS